ncbi:hypothetical protein DFQ26_003026 [Actinomortierella ambigua]|nr:hypothetical protein DFQ26_003026 [Actinomortierella ambigua]
MMRPIVSLILLAQLCLAVLAIKFDQLNEKSVWIYGRSYSISFSEVPQSARAQRWQVDLMVLGAKCNEEVCTQDGPVARIADNYRLSKKLKWTVPSTLAHHGKGFFVQLSNKGNEPLIKSEIFAIEHVGTL